MRQARPETRWRAARKRASGNAFTVRARRLVRTSRGGGASARRTYLDVSPKRPSAVPGVPLAARVGGALGTRKISTGRPFQHSERPAPVSVIHSAGEPGARLRPTQWALAPHTAPCATCPKGAPMLFASRQRMKRQRQRVLRFRSGHAIARGVNWRSRSTD